MMKTSFATLFLVFIYCSLSGQDFNTMTGDWIRVKSEYSDGGKVPNNDPSRVYVRYHFTKKELYQIIFENTLPGVYTRTGNIFKIEPIQVFVIEHYTDKALTLVDAEGPRPIRYCLIPTDSFQTTRKYVSEVVNGDSVYTVAPGIEPMYPKGQNEFMSSITSGFSQQTVAFNFTYIVQRDGTIGEVAIQVSSNPKLDKRLVQMVKKSSGKWIPATYHGKPINVRMKGAFSFRG